MSRQSTSSSRKLQPKKSSNRAPTGAGPTALLRRASTTRPKPKASNLQRATDSGRATVLDPPADPTERLMRVVAALICVGVPLAYLPGALNRFHDVKVFTLTLAIGVGLVALMWSGRLRWAPVGRFGLPILIVMAISTVINGPSRMTLLGYESRHAGMWMWLLSAGAFVVGTSASAATADVARRGLVLAGTVMAAVALVQFAGVDLLRGPDVVDRPTSTMGNAGYTGAFLAIALMMAIAAIAEAQPGRPRKIVVAQTGLIAVALVLTGARAAWLGVLVASVMLVVMWRKNPVVWKSALAAGTVLGALVLAIPTTRRRVSGGFDLASGTVRGRLDLWQTVPSTVQPKPVFGWGPDATRHALPFHLPENFEAKYGTSTIPDRVHNYLGDVAIWGGVAAALAMVVFTVAILVALYRSRRVSPWVLVTMAATVAYLGHLMFNFDIVELDPIVMFLIGLGLTSTAYPAAPRWRVYRTAATAVVATVLLALSIGYVAADFAAGQAFKAEMQGRTDDGLQWWQHAQAFSFGDPTYFEGEARLAQRASRWDIAVASSARAAESGDPYLAELALDERLDRLTHADAVDPVELADLDAQYTAFVEKWPYHASLHNSLGVIAIAQDAPELAVTRFTEAVRLLPDDKSFQENLSKAQVQVDESTG